jgi:hypothetical protein
MAYADEEGTSSSRQQHHGDDRAPGQPGERIADRRLARASVDREVLARALGACSVRTVDPHDLEGTRASSLRKWPLAPQRLHREGAVCPPSP